MDHRLVHISTMTKVPLSQAKAQLTDLVRRAEGGESIVLTRHGKDVVRLVPSGISPELKAKRLAAIRKAQALAAGKLPVGFSAARSQDFLYGEDGMPD